MKIILIAFFILNIAGCGFSPVYKKGDDDALKHTQFIEVAVIDGKAGIVAREKLRDTLTPYGEDSEPLYKLEFTKIHSAFEKKGIRADGTPSWGTIITTFEYQLVRIEDKKVLLKDKEFSFTSYNILDNVYSSALAEDQAQVRGYTDIASKIAKRIMAYFKDNVKVKNEGN